MTLWDKSPIIMYRWWVIGKEFMPTIGILNGITIIMFLRGKEHAPPHVHAIMQEYDAPFLISTGNIMAGDFPKKSQILVKNFIKKYQKVSKRITGDVGDRKLSETSRINNYVSQSNQFRF